MNPTERDEWVDKAREKRNKFEQKICSFCAPLLLVIVLIVAIKEKVEFSFENVFLLVGVSMVCAIFVAVITVKVADIYCPRASRMKNFVYEP